MPGAITNEPILIIGGGLGGLCLAQGLRKAGIPFQVFERDQNVNWRPQGYRLRINGEGTHALKSVLTPELYERYLATCASTELGETDINAIDGSLIASRAGGGPAMKGLKPSTCDREVLRGILLEGLGDSVIYAKQLSKYEEVDHGVVAHFADGSSATGRFLVGADGKSSVTRRLLLPDHHPVDTDGLCIYGKTPITPELQDRFPAAGMRWMTLVVDRTPITQMLDVDNTAVTLLLEPIRFGKTGDDLDQYKPDDYMYWVLIARKSLFGIADDVNLSSFSNDEVAEISLRLTQCWDPHLRSILHLQDRTQSSFLRVLSAKPDMAAWEPSDKATLVGDAVHMMSPCGGVGAVSALVDGANLASIIASKGVSHESIGEYEKGMREFAGAMIRRSYMGGRALFGQQPFEQCNEFRS